MIIEKQVCSLELAKRLKELGAKRESLFYWKTDGGDPYLVARNSRYMTSKGEIQGAAFTVAELGEMLPITVHGDFDNLICDKAIEHWFIYYTTAAIVTEVRGQQMEGYTFRPRKRRPILAPRC